MEVFEYQREGGVVFSVWGVVWSRVTTTKVRPPLGPVTAVALGPSSVPETPTPPQLLTKTYCPLHPSGRLGPGV